jgi:hypothetical protein
MIYWIYFKRPKVLSMKSYVNDLIYLNTTIMKFNECFNLLYLVITFKRWQSCAYYHITDYFMNYSATIMLSKQKQININKEYISLKL